MHRIYARKMQEHANYLQSLCKSFAYGTFIMPIAIVTDINNLQAEY